MRKIILCTVIALLAASAFFGWYAWQVATMQKDHQQTLIIAPDLFAAKSDGQVRLVVRDQANGKAAAEARVKLTLATGDGKEIALAVATTDDTGTANISFVVPEVAEGNHRLRVETISTAGRDVEELPVEIKKEFKILLNSDKPLYQPGQVIHIRSLVMGSFAAKPVQQQDIVLEVLDPKGNKVFKKSLATSQFGIAAADFPLATEVNEGEYQIRAICGKTTTDKRVTVKRYVLPKFKIEAQFDKNYYRPGEVVKGQLSARYFFGKPVSAGKIAMTVATFDVNWNKLLEWQGNSDSEGRCAIEFKLPDSMYGNALQKGDALVKVDISVTDTAAHSQKISRTLTVAEKAMQIVAIPESGNIVAGIANKVYLCTVYPDGTPAQTEIQLAGQTLKSNVLGIAEGQVVPDRIPYTFTVSAKDGKGTERTEELTLTAQGQGDFVTVLDKATYRAGDEVALEILSQNRSGNYYIDLVKNRQTVFSRTVEVNKGHLQTSFVLPQDLSGTVILRVYRIGADSVIQRDTRVIFVSPPADLSIEARLDKNVYKPGEQATIEFTTDSESALSIAIVDESVFALQEMQPGLEKVYFMLHQELLKPRYQIRYRAPLADAEVVSLAPGNQGSETDSGQVDEAKHQAAKVMFAMAGAQADEMNLVDSYAPKRERVATAKRQFARDLRTFICSLPLIALVLFYLAFIVKFALKIKRAPEQNYAEEGSTSKAQKILALLQFHHWILPLHLLALIVISIVAEAARPNRFGCVVLFSVGLLVFIALFSLTQREKTRVSWAWLATAVIIAGGASVVLYNKWQDWGYRSDTMEVLAGVFVIGGAKALLLSFYYGIRYSLFSEKLKGSGNAAVMTLLFLVLAAFVIGSVIAIQFDYSWRRSLHNGWTDLAIIIAVAVTLLSFPLFNNYLRSFLQRAGWGRFFFGVTAAPLAIGLCFLLLFSSLGAVGDKGMRQLEMRAERVFDAVTGDMSKTATAIPGASSESSPESVRIRQHFPETLYWNPQLLTKNGKASITIPVSDSITTFRMVCQGVDGDGKLGSMTRGIRVFQDFFVDIDFPVALTQNDEVSVPVQVYNYLPSSQRVRLVVEKEDWFELLGEAEQTLSIAANQVSVVSFRLRAKRVGQRRLTVFAYGEKMNDAVRRAVAIEPDGQKFEKVINGELTKTIEHQCTIPPEAIPEASQIVAKCYPGVAAVLVEGLEGMIQLPGG